MIRSEVRLDVSQMRAGLKALEDAWPPYITITWLKGAFDDVEGHVTGVSERARRELGTWPSPETMFDRLAAALVQAADAEPEVASGPRCK